MDELAEDLTPGGTAQEARIFFAEVLKGFTLPVSGCRRGCNCMLDPEKRKTNVNTSANNDLEDQMADQNPTTWPIDTDSSYHVKDYYNNNISVLENVNQNRNDLSGGIHTNAADAACHLLAQNHTTNKSSGCVGLQHGKTEEQQRYSYGGSNQVLRDKCNEVLRRIWCEQQAHGLTNLCYFISETEKICFDALGIPCDQIYGWLDRGSKSFTHAWVKLGEKKQLIDITFYLEKSRSFPGGYWVSLSDYKEGPGPKTMENETLFKTTHHWRYVYLCTLVEDRRNYMRCMFKYMTNEMQVRLPDVFKDAVSTCWNCDTHLGPSKTICSDCSSAVFCSEKCLKEERNKTPSHLEICADYIKRQKNKSLTLKKPPIASMDELLKGR